MGAGGRSQSFYETSQITICMGRPYFSRVRFADDTNLFMSRKDPVDLAASLNSELNKLSTWFKANKLSLNLKKKNFMHKRTENRTGKEMVFLGVVLDEHLSWKSHISQVARKI